MPQNTTAQPDYVSLLPHSPVREHLFGLDLAFHGETLLIASPGDGRYELPYWGVIEVYGRVDEVWQLIQTVRPAGPATDVRFGREFELIDDELFAWSSAGIFVFKHREGTWQEIQKMVPPDSVSFGIGWTLAVVDSSRVFIHGLRPNGTVWGQGAVLEFVRSDSTWEYQRFFETSPEVGDGFGRSMIVCNNTLVVGAPNDPTAENESGSVFVFSLDDRETQPIQKIVPPEAAGFDQFGSSLACYGDQLIVHANSAGYTLTYTQVDGAWVENGAIEVPMKNNFLGPFHVIDDRLYINANAFETSPYDPNQSITPLYVYQYEVGTWNLLKTMDIGHLLEPWENEDGAFGHSVALNDRFLAVGAPYRTRMGENAAGETVILDQLGEVFIYDLGDVFVSVDRLSAVEAGPLAFSLYPNPTAGRAAVEFERPSENRPTATVYDLTGRVVFSKELEPQRASIDLGDAAAGLYLVRICAETTCAVSGLLKVD